MPKGTKYPKTSKRLKSSRRARELIRCALARYGSQRKAARALGLTNQAQLHRMLHGLIRDTPAMKAAIVRAKERARRAYHFIPPDRGVARAQTSMPDFKSIDMVIDAYLPKLQAYEINYLDAKGRGYMQALWSHSAPPADGALVAPDLLASKPTDQAESLADLWSAVVIASGEIPVRLRIDVYDGPDGKGYVIIVECIVAARTYTRSINTGGEKWREQAWIEVKPDTLP